MTSRLITQGLPVVAGVALFASVVHVARTQPPDLKAEPAFPPPAASFSDTMVGAVGLVEPASERVAISTPVAGLVKAVHVAPNGRVKRGDALFTLDDRDLRAELKEREEALAAAETRLQRLKALPRPEDVPPARARVEAARAHLGDAEKQLAFMENIPDSRAIQAQELSRRRFARESALADLHRAEAELKQLLAGAWAEDIAVAKTQVAEARAALERVRTNLDRLTVRAPMDGDILKLDVRAGEYAQTGKLPEPLIVMGSRGPWHVRADINEEDAGRVAAGAAAEASLRGDAGRRFKLSFVRFEPYVIPKKSLTGANTERVDTRVLQAIYRVEPTELAMFVGQQVDVFIAAAGRGGRS
jgi:multidrug resistance efflux pump